MSFGTNLQFLRKMHNGMTQEELAEKMRVSRQTVSKWELDGAYPEMDKVVELCRLFSCSMDSLIREDMNICDEAYSDIRIETLGAFRYARYAVISADPETDAINRARAWAEKCSVSEPEIIGWDFPFVSQEQINVFHMHGYAAAWVLPEGITVPDENAEIMEQPEIKYVAITIKEPFKSPFYIIPNAYKTLDSYMKVNGLEYKSGKDLISCFEKEYMRDGVWHMDVYIAIK